MIELLEKRRWRIGERVVPKGTRGLPGRIVIGYKPDGSCMTVYEVPPPWMTRAQGHHIYIDDASDLVGVAV